MRNTRWQLLSRFSVHAVCNVTGFLCLLAAPVKEVEARIPPSVELRVPKAPTIGVGEDGAFIAYEVHFTNLGAIALTISRVEVETGGATPRLLLTLSDSALVQNMARPGVSVPAAERARIAEISVTSPAVVIGPPLRGGPWLAGNGPSSRSGHRRALIAVEGKPAIAQRFAIDFVKMNDCNSTFTGDRLKNESYLAANSPLGSEGVPYAFDSFELIGSCQSFTACTRKTPERRVKQIPLERALVRFP